MIRRFALATLLAASATVPIAPSPAAAQQSGLACAASAASDYFKQKLAIFQSHPLFSSPSIELTLEKRRLKEDYCLRYTRCLFSDSSSFFFEQTFAGCVRDKD